ncbi:MAG: MMPL family transporter [Actinobacteria bacterium]|nr:MMPL family transporter [Actinomycetota bacterium]
MLETWTRAVIRRRFTVVLTWAAIAVLGLIASPKLSENLTTSLTVPGSESEQADDIISERFNENIEGTFTVFYKFKQATSVEIDGFKVKIEIAAGVIPSSQVTLQRAVGGILFASISTPFSLPQAAGHTEDLRIALARQGLKGAQVTGPPAIYRDVTPVLADDLRRGQLFAVTLALILLLLLLGFCRAVILPFIFAAATISLTIGIVFMLSHRLLMVVYTPNIVELIGLGLAIDYSLLIVHRFRREIMDNEAISTEDAIVKTLETAGRTVVLSGLSVSIGLATLLLVPVPFVRSLGVAGLIVPIASLLAALTLQPALLSYLGRTGVVAKGFTGLMTRKDLNTGFVARLAQFVVRKPLSVAIFSVATLALLASSVLWLQVTPSSLTALPAELESSQALNMATGRAGPGVITPHQIVVDLGSPNKLKSSAVLEARARLSTLLKKDPEVFVMAVGEKPPYVEQTGRYFRIFVIGHHDIGAKQTQKLVKDLREKYIPQSRFPSDAKIYIGGAPAQGSDLLNRIYSSFPWIVLLALALAYLTLLRAFRSLVLPLKAIILDLISVAVAYASLVLVFRFGFASSILGTYRLDQIEAWVLIFLFAVLFGLSMDYEVFIVARIREARLNGASNTDAIIEGIVHTSGVVTAAAVILVGALGGFVGGHFAGLQQLGIGLACGILIDATIIRGLLLPSAMVLLGRWNWWLPSSIAKIAKTKASPLEDRVTRP